MKKLTGNRYVLLFGTFGLIIVAIIFGAILSSVSSKSSTSDTRARASGARMLELNAVVSQIDETRGVLIVDNIYFADNSRSGDAVNYGLWNITPPPSYNLLSNPPGTNIVISIKPETFLATTRSLTAVSIKKTK